MPDWRKILRSAPFGMIVLATGAAALYIALLVNAGAPLAGGEAAFSQAWSGFLLTLMLWTALALLLVVGAVMGRMPASAAIIEVFLHPISGVAAFVALDAASRRVGAGLLLLVLLPLPIASYAFWARLTYLHKAYPPRPVSFVAVGAIAFLSVCALATGL